MDAPTAKTIIGHDRALFLFTLGWLVVAEDMAGRLVSTGYFIDEKELLDPASEPRGSGLPLPSAGHKAERLGPGLHGRRDPAEGARLLLPHSVLVDSDRCGCPPGPLPRIPGCRDHQALRGGRHGHRAPAQDGDRSGTSVGTTGGASLDGSRGPDFNPSGLEPRAAHESRFACFPNARPRNGGVWGPVSRGALLASELT